MIEHCGAVRVPLEDESYDALLGSILLLGEDNPQSSRPEFQLYPRPSGCAGHRLQSTVLELPEYHYLAIWRANLCSPTWNSLAARQRMWKLLDVETPWTTIVALGRKVAKTFELALETKIVFDRDGVDSGPMKLEPFSTASFGAKRVVSLPHPSGRCREWNDASAFTRAQSLMRLVAPTVRWGGALL